MDQNKKSIVVVIPMYRHSINANEKISLEQALKVLSAYDIFFIVPEGLSFDPVHLIPGNGSLTKTHVIRFADKYFSSTINYSKLLISKDFYIAFDQYTFMLVYQLDAYVFYDDLPKWVSKGYDYIGAAWTKEHEQFFYDKMYKGKFKVLFSIMRGINRTFFGKKDYAIGNGGLSLRNIQKSIKALKILYFLSKRWAIHEDLFWGMAAPTLYPFFKVPNKADAFNFSFEYEPKKLFEKNGNKLPFGCHAWEKYDPAFWKQYIPSASVVPSTNQ